MACPPILVYNVLVFLLLVHSSFGEFKNQVMAHCPQFEFCTVKSNVTFRSEDLTHDSVPCCSPCSCDKDCWMVDKCCTDVQHKPPVDLKTADCKPLIVNRSMSYEDHRSQGNFYRLIDFCPCNGDVSPDIVEKCNNRFSGQVDMEDIVAVSDTRYWLYKNKYCAMCHGKTEIISWKLAISFCKAEFFSVTMTPENFVKVLMEYCMLRSYPPPRLPYGGSNMMCFSATDTCTMSSTEDIEEGCHFGPNGGYTTVSPDATCLHVDYASTHTEHCSRKCCFKISEAIPYFHQYRLGQILDFKNVLCFVCNEDYQLQGHTDSVCSNTNLGHARAFPKMALLVDMGVSKRISKRAVTECSTSEVFDTLQGMCVKLFCHYYSFGFNGKCITMSDYKSKVLRLIIPFEPTKEISFSESFSLYDANRANQIIFKYLTMFGLSKCSVGRFVTNIVIERDSGRLICVAFEVNVLIDDACSMDDISEAVRVNLSSYRNISMKLNNVEVDMSGKIDFYLETDKMFQYEWYGDSQYDVYKVVFKRAMSYRFDIDFFLCPYFVLNVTRYNSLVTNVFGRGGGGNLTEVSRFTKLEEGFYQLSPDRIAVCVDTYFGLYADNGGAAVRRRFDVACLAGFSGLLVTVARLLMLD